MRRADELLERVGLGDKRDRRPGELSGGEQQRVALCAALAHRPRVFLADEPTGELDSRTADQVYDVLAELVREHRCTTVIVSHDPESTRIADRIVRIRDGRVSEEWARDGADSDTIVVGRGGWLRLPGGAAASRRDRLARDGVVRGRRAGRRTRGRARGGANRCQTPFRCQTLAPSDAHRRRGARPREALRQHASCSTGSTRRSSAGRLHAVVGPSGSGKTTLLHLLAGLELPDAGTITVDGAELTALDRTARAALRRERIAYVGQQAGLVPHLSALENVELALALRGLEENSRLTALAALESVGLGERATQHVSRLSQGERARVAIARAIASKPTLLLADEPTSRLDGANAIAVAVLLAPARARHGRGGGVLDARPARDRAGGRSDHAVARSSARARTTSRPRRSAQPPSETSRIRSAIRSRKYRSCETKIAVPSKSSSALSSISTESMSRWFVGSSSSRQFAPWSISSSSCSRVHSPPESAPIGRRTCS